jgi:hypothetical protein
MKGEAAASASLVEFDWGLGLPSTMVILIGVSHSDYPPPPRPGSEAGRRDDPDRGTIPTGGLGGKACRA